MFQNDSQFLNFCDSLKMIHLSFKRHVAWLLVVLQRLVVVGIQQLRVVATIQLSLLHRTSRRLIPAYAFGEMFIFSAISKNRATKNLQFLKKTCLCFFDNCFLIFMVLQCKNQDWWRHLLRHSNSFFDHFSPVEISYLTVWKIISVIIQSSYINGLSTTKTLTKCTMTTQETMRTEISSSEKII